MAERYVRSRPGWRGVQMMTGSYRPIISGVATATAEDGMVSSHYPKTGAGTAARRLCRSLLMPLTGYKEREQQVEFPR